MPPKISLSTLLSNTQQELKQSVSRLLSFFQDDRGKNLLRSFSALSQCYIDLRAVCLFGANNNNNTAVATQNNKKEEEIFSIVYSPSQEKLESTFNKIQSIRDRIDSITAASSSLLNELLQLLSKSKELSHNTYLAAFNVIYNNDNENQTDDDKNQNQTAVNVHLRLLKDVLETLVNTQLQNKFATIHVIFNEVQSCVSFSQQRQQSNNNESNDQLREIRWKLTLDQLRVYQTALTAEFTALGIAGAGSNAGGQQTHPLESIPSLLDRVGILCGKIGGL